MRAFRLSQAVERSLENAKVYLWDPLGRRACSREREGLSLGVDKKGTLFSFATCPPCQPAGYGVRGFWLDEWLAAGKLTRAVYPYWAAKVHTGFARRLGDVRAVERWGREQEVLRESRLRARLRVPYGQRPTSAGLRLRASARAKGEVAWRKSLARTA